jgi:hypothetical protein
LIPESLWHGAEAYGFRGSAWTRARVAKVIEEEFGVAYDKSRVSRLLKRLGWTRQAPIRRAGQRDEQAIERWRMATWPRLLCGERCVKHIFRSQAPISRLPRHERALLGVGQVA